MNNFLVVLFNLFFVFSFAQEKNNIIVYDIVDIKAEPTMGLTQFKNNVLQYFIEINKNVSENTIIALKVSFDVSKNGSLSNYKIESELPSEKNYANQLIDYLSKSDAWKPAQLKNLSVNSNYLFSIKFQITTSKDLSTKDVVIEKAEPIEGFEKFYENLYTNIKIPYLEEVGTYTLKISFVVIEDGTLTDFNVVEELPKKIGLAEAVIITLRSFPKWKTNNTKNYITLPMSVTLEAGKIIPYEKK